MKNFILYSVSIAVSMVWLITFHQTYNPIALKGPDFLQFYLMLLVGFHTLFLLGKFLKIYHYKIGFYFMISILILGLIKLARGIQLGKPVGYLIFLILIKIIVMVLFKSKHIKKYT